MEYNKPPLTFNEQLDLLISRGLLVKDKNTALSHLRNISYYRLSAYFLPFKQSEEFKTNVFFENIIDLYTFDRKLRLLILEAIEPIEIAIRTQIIYHLSHKYGAFCYLQPQIFSHRFNHAKWLQDLEKSILGSNETFISHFNKKYTASSHMPLWMALEVITFGGLSKLYRGLKGNDQEEISRQYGLQSVILHSWLHTLVYIRNLCAHHARLWNRTLTVKPQMPAKKPAWQIPNNRVYCLINMMGFLLHQINPSSGWKTRLVALLKSSSQIQLPVMEMMGFPPTWFSQFSWQEIKLKQEESSKIIGD